MPLQSRSRYHLMRQKIPALYLYSDVVEDELVGDSKVPLLRTVPISGKRGDMVNINFPRPFFKPVTKGYINSIEIEIKDDTGKNISFNSGKVICVLHFRKCCLQI